MDQEGMLRLEPPHPPLVYGTCNEHDATGEGHVGRDHGHEVVLSMTKPGDWLVRHHSQILSQLGLGRGDHHLGVAASHSDQSLHPHDAAYARGPRIAGEEMIIFLLSAASAQAEVLPWRRALLPAAAPGLQGCDEPRQQT